MLIIVIVVENLEKTSRAIQLLRILIFTGRVR